LIVFITAIVVWFIIGFAVAFGSNPNSATTYFAGFNHGYFGDFTGGIASSDPSYTKTILYN